MMRRECVDPVPLLAVIQKQANCEQEADGAQKALTGMRKLLHQREDFTFLFGLPVQWKKKKK